MEWLALGLIGGSIAVCQWLNYREGSPRRGFTHALQMDEIRKQRQAGGMSPDEATGLAMMITYRPGSAPYQQGVELMKRSKR